MTLKSKRLGSSSQVLLLPAAPSNHSGPLRETKPSAKNNRAQALQRKGKEKERSDREPKGIRRKRGTILSAPVVVQLLIPLFFRRPSSGGVSGGTEGTDTIRVLIHAKAPAGALGC